MSSDREVNRIVRSWLEEGVTTLPDRVLDNVLDQLPATPQRRARWPARRLNPMNTVRFAVAAAAVVVAAVVGINLMPGPGVGTGPTAAPSPTPTSSPITTALPAFGALAPGTYVIDSPFPLRVSMVLGEGWNVWSGVTSGVAAIYKDSPDPPNGKGIIVTLVANVYADPCDASAGALVPQLGSTVDDLATALAGQPMTESSPVTDTSIDGYTGRYLEYTYPENYVPGPGDPGCEGGQSLVRWPSVAGDRQALMGEHDKVWILDVDGVRLVIDAFSFPGATPADHAEIQVIVESIQIEPAADG
jgi:hypothetical protein